MTTRACNSSNKSCSLGVAYADGNACATNAGEVGRIHLGILAWHTVSECEIRFAHINSSLVNLNCLKADCHHAITFLLSLPRSHFPLDPLLTRVSASEIVSG